MKTLCKLSFYNVFFVISGDIETRLHNLMNVLLVSEIYECNFKIMWVKNDEFNVSIEDIYTTSIFSGKITDDISFVKDTLYYYNPDISIYDILKYTISTNSICNRNVKIYDWLVIDNLDNSATNMIPENMLSSENYINRLNSIYKTMTLNPTILGKVNLFKQRISRSKKVINVYINDVLDVYIKYLKTLPEHLDFYFIFSKMLTTCDVKSHILDLKETFKDRCITICYGGQSSLMVNIINFKCMQVSTNILIVLDSIDSYVHELITYVNIGTIVYSIRNNKCSNVDVKLLDIFV